MTTAAGSTSGEPPDAGVHVLVVDDDVDFADLTATYLERDTSLTTSTRHRADAALDALAANGAPDCIVSDHDMPGMNGLEFLAAVRDDHPELPFILFTGKGNEEIASEAVTAGVTDYVKKGGPEQYDVLANRIENAVDRRRSQVALREEKELLEQVLATTPGSIVCNRDGTIAYATARAARTLGVERDCLVGSSWADPTGWAYTDFDGNDLETATGPVSRVFETGERVTDAEVAVSAGGEHRYLSVDAAPLGDRGDEGYVERAVVSFRDVSEQIEHERRVETSEKKYQALVESLPDAVVLIEDETGTVIEANERAGDLLGRDREDVVGRHVTDLHPAEEADRYERFFERGLPREPGAEATSRVFDDGTPVEVVTADGERVPVEIRGAVLELDGRLLVHGLFRDRSAETDRQRELERTRTVLDAVGDATYALDEDGVFTYANDALADLSGYDVEELVGAHSSHILPDDEVQRGTELLQDLLDDGEERGIIQMEIEHASGERIPVENHIALLPSTGRFRGSAGIARDITDRLERERRLRESEQKYASVVEEANDGVVIAQDGVIKFVNPKACDILHGEPDELVGKPIPEVVASGDRETVADRMRKRLRGEDPERRYEFTAKALDGTETPIEFTASVITYEGDPAVLAICRDVSERKQRERELEQYESIVQTAPDGVFIVDEHANYVGGNIPGAELTGYTPDELAGMSVPDLVDEGVFGPEVIPRYTETVSHLLSSKNDDRKGKFEFTIERDGERRVYECHVSIRPFDPEEGESFRGSIGVLRDVTERKHRERELERQNDRLEEFANVVGHDLRNPLNVAAGNLELARESGDSDTFDRVATAHDRMAEILDDLLTLARSGRTVDDTEPVTLHDAARTAWATVDTGNATLELGDDVAFDADAGRLRQLLENLYANAITHAGPDVTVTVDALPGDEGFSVGDDGPGIPEEVAASVFDPGVTTRTDGTGFGLAIVADIAESHGWTASLGPTERGTRIEIQF